LLDEVSSRSSPARWLSVRGSTTAGTKWRGTTSPAGVQRPELLLGDGLDSVEQIPFGEFGRELVVRIVMVDAVGEPHFLEVLLERLPLGCRAVAAVVFVDDLQRPAHRQVRRTVLVVEDVAAALGASDR